MNTSHYGVLVILLLACACPLAAATGIVVDAGEDQTVSTAETVAITAIFDDPLFVDNHSAAVAWGDDAVNAREVDEQNCTVAAQHVYEAAGTYAVEVNVTHIDGGYGTDILNVTVQPVALDMKIAPRSLHPWSNGIMTVFITLSDAFGLNLAEEYGNYTLNGAEPERVHMNMKNGGTLMLKFRRQVIGLDAEDNETTLQVNATGASGKGVAAAGKDTVKIPGNGNAVKKNLSSTERGNGAVKEKGIPPGQLKQKSK
ncbi:MAG TPA: hypothetical protein ENN85_01555 [Methanoculleus sp.]|nr:hypothetical protein [Methanoculleus sp.]